VRLLVESSTANIKFQQVMQRSIRPWLSFVTQTYALPNQTKCLSKVQKKSRQPKLRKQTGIANHIILQHSEICLSPTTAITTGVHDFAIFLRPQEVMRVLPVFCYLIVGDQKLSVLEKVPKA